MALPKNQSPVYPLAIPSTSQEVKFRPFVVKDEKALMLAMQSENEVTMVNTLRDLIRNCVEEEIDVDRLATFDLEYIFAQMRGKSVGEMVELIGKCDNVEAGCVDNPKAQVKLQIDITQIPVHFPEGHDKKIMFDDKTGLVMRYPSMKEFVDREFLQKEMKTDEVYEFIADSIDQIFDDEEVYDSSTTTKKEFRTFVDSLTTKQFEKIQKFYETSPKLSHTFKVVNPKTGKESSYTIEGLQSFFA